MPFTWNQVTSDPEYKSFTPEEKDGIKQWFKSEYIEKDTEYQAADDITQQYMADQIFAEPVQPTGLPAGIQGGTVSPGQLPPPSVPQSAISQTQSQPQQPQGILDKLVARSREITSAKLNQPSMAGPAVEGFPQSAPLTSIPPYQPPEKPLSPEEQRAALTRGVVASHNLMAGNLVPEMGQMAYLPAKYLVEKSIAATFGKKTYEELFKGLNDLCKTYNIHIGAYPIGELPAKIAAAGARLLSSGAFWWGFGKVIGEDPAKYVLGDQDAEKIKDAIAKGDYETVGQYLQSNPKLVQKAFGVNGIKAVMDKIKINDPDAYKQIFQDLLSQRVTGETPVTQPTPEPVGPVQPTPEQSAIVNILKQRVQGLQGMEQLAGLPGNELLDQLIKSTRPQESLAPLLDQLINFTEQSQKPIPKQPKGKQPAIATPKPAKPEDAALLNRIINPENDIFIRKPMMEEIIKGIPKVSPKEGYEVIYKSRGNTGDPKENGWYYRKITEQTGEAQPTLQVAANAVTSPVTPLITPQATITLPQTPPVVPPQTPPPAPAPAQALPPIFDKLVQQQAQQTQPPQATPQPPMPSLEEQFARMQEQMHQKEQPPKEQGVPPAKKIDFGSDAVSKLQAMMQGNKVMGRSIEKIDWEKFQSAEGKKPWEMNEKAYIDLVKQDPRKYAVKEINPFNGTKSPVGFPQKPHADAEIKARNLGNDVQIIQADKQYWIVPTHGSFIERMRKWAPQAILDKLVQGQVKAKGEVSELTPRDREYLAWMKEEVNQGQPGYWGRWNVELDKFVEGTGGISTYPDWVKNQGLTKKGVIRVIEKMENGESFTEGQVMQKRIRDLVRREVDHFQEEETVKEDVPKDVIRAEWAQTETPGEKIIASEGQPAIRARDLTEGQKINIDGEEFIVSKGGDGDLVYLEDGETIVLKPGQAIKAQYIEEGTVPAEEDLTPPQKTTPASLLTAPTGTITPIETQGKANREPLSREDYYKSIIGRNRKPIEKQIITGNFEHHRDLVQKAWNIISTRYPKLANYVLSIEIIPMFPITTGTIFWEGAIFPDKTIKINGDWLDTIEDWKGISKTSPLEKVTGILGHEITHLAQKVKNIPQEILNTPSSSESEFGIGEKTAYKRGGEINRAGRGYEKYLDQLMQQQQVQAPSGIPGASTIPIEPQGKAITQEPGLPPRNAPQEGKGALAKEPKGKKISEGLSISPKELLREVLAAQPDLPPAKDIPDPGDERGSISPAKFTQRAGEIKKDIKSFIQPEFNPGAKRSDQWINDIHLHSYRADKDFKRNMEDNPDEEFRKEEFLDLVHGGEPSTSLQQEWRAKSDAWGDRALEAGLIPGKIPDYVHFGLANPKAQVAEAMTLLRDRPREWLEGVNPVFNTKSGSFRKRTSADWEEFTGKIERLNKMLEDVRSDIVLEPQTDLAVLLHDWEKEVGRAVLNQEFINWLEKNVNPTTGKPMITVKPETYNDPDYKLLPKNIKVKWLGVDGKMIPFKYFVHKDVYPMLENFTEPDLGNKSKLAQGWIGINDAVKRMLFWNPIVLGEKMTTRLIATERGRPLLDIVRLRFPWYKGTQMLKDDPTIQRAIGSGLTLYFPDEMKERAGAPIEDEEAKTLKSQIEQILGYPLKINDRMVSTILNSSRVQFWGYLENKFIKDGFTPKEAARMASEKANRKTYSIPKHMMNKGWRTIGKMTFISRNSIENLVRTARSLGGGEQSIFTEKQMNAMSKEEWGTLLALVGFFGILPALLNKKVTGKFVNTEEGYRGKTAVYKDENGRVYYIPTLDYGQDLINILWGQQEKLIGKLAYVPRQIIEQTSKVDLITGKKIDKSLTGRVIHAVRSALPGKEGAFFVDTMPEFMDSVKRLGWGKTFRNFSTGQYLDLLLPAIGGKNVGHGWVGMAIVGDGMDEAQKEREEKKGTLNNLLRSGDKVEAAKQLAGEGKSIEEIIKALQKNPKKSPIVHFFSTLPPELKIKYYNKLKKDKLTWNNLDPQDRNDIAQKFVNAVNAKSARKENIWDGSN